MRHSADKINFAVGLLVFITASLLIGAKPFYVQKVEAAQLGSRTLQLSSGLANAANVTYNVSIHITTPGTLGSIQFEFCSNSTIPSDPCTPPSGFDASNVNFSQETGVGGFVVSPNSTANDIIITRPPNPTLAVTATFEFDNITNPTNAGSYYLRVLTYPTSDATGAYTDNGGMAFAVNPAVNVSVKVPPYLLFCTGNTITGTDCSTALGNYLDLGALSTTHTGNGYSQMVIATNGQNGYNISVNGSTLTSGNNTIPPLISDATSQIGVSQFGINLRVNSNPNVGVDPSGPGIGSPTASYDQPNNFRYNNGDIVATAGGVTDYRKFTVSYIVNISKQQPAGIYASTFTYVALSNF